jgi:hypothetical protein
VLERGLEATLRPRERVWRLVGGLRVEHPADIETDVDGHRWKGLRVSADDEVLEAYGLLGHEGGLAVLVRHQTTGAEQATTLLASVVAPMVR